MYQCMIHMFGIKIAVSYVCKPENRPTCDSQSFQSAILLWWWPNATKVECVVSEELAVPRAWSRDNEIVPKPEKCKALIPSTNYNSDVSIYAKGKLTMSVTLAWCCCRWLLEI